MSWFSSASHAASAAANAVVTTVSGAADTAASAANNIAAMATVSAHAAEKQLTDATVAAVKKASDASKLAAAKSKNVADILALGTPGVISKAAKEAAAEAAKVSSDAASAATLAVDEARRSAESVSSLSRSLSRAFPVHIGDAANLIAGAERAAQQTLEQAELAAQAAADVAAQADEIAEELGRQLSEVPPLIAADVARAIKNSPLYKWLVDNMAALYMDKPNILPIPPIGRGPCPPAVTSVARSSEPVYYVNGMLTPLAQARDEGQFLADFLGRTVNLIQNPTVREAPFWTGTYGMFDDASEAVYDRFWPENFLTGTSVTPDLATLLEPNLGGSLSLTLPFTQLNTTTRQIAYVLYHANGPVAFVSHSQGCLQVRNASLITAMFRGEDWIGQHLLWVATGLPLSDVEIWPWPKKFKGMVNHGDYVAQLIGLQGGPGMLDAMSGASHNFLKYVCEINPDGLLP